MYLCEPIEPGLPAGEVYLVLKRVCCAARMEGRTAGILHNYGAKLTAKVETVLTVWERIGIGSKA